MAAAKANRIFLLWNDDSLKGVDEFATPPTGGRPDVGIPAHAFPWVASACPGRQRYAMHLRPAFIEIDPARIRTLIEAHSFGLLVTAADGMDASHIPFTVHDTGADDAGAGFELCGHLAAANRQCAWLDGGTALAVFVGPHAYVSPSWYTAQPSVPTWDYVAVHVHGVLSMMAHDADVTDRLQEMAAHDPAGFQVGTLPDTYRAAMFAGIRAFRLTPTRIEAQWKMSQNRSQVDRHGVVEGLRAQGGGDEGRVADLIAAGLTQA